jgi:hypothetical protein
MLEPSTEPGRVGERPDRGLRLQAAFAQIESLMHGTSRTAKEYSSTPYETVKVTHTDATTSQRRLSSATAGTAASPSVMAPPVYHRPATIRESNAFAHQRTLHTMACVKHARPETRDFGQERAQA